MDSANATCKSEAATFYYDETNNVRKLHVDEGSLNVPELNVFVLGGIVHAGRPHPIDLAPLREGMRIQKTADEIKLRHVAPGTYALDQVDDFPQMDLGQRLHKIEDPMLLHGHVVLKSDLTEILRAEFDATIDLFHRYAYPSLSPEARGPFLRELIALVQRSRVRPRKPHSAIYFSAENACFSEPPSQLKSGSSKRWSSSPPRSPI